MRPREHVSIERFPHRTPRAKLIRVLSTGLGAALASERVNQTADLLGFGQELSRREVMHVLDRLAQCTGVVAVSASFTKAQVALWSDFPQH